MCNDKSLIESSVFILKVLWLTDIQTWSLPCHSKGDNYIYLFFDLTLTEWFLIKYKIYRVVHIPIWDKLIKPKPCKMADTRHTRSYVVLVLCQSVIYSWTLTALIIFNCTFRNLSFDLIEIRNMSLVTCNSVFSFIQVSWIFDVQIKFAE